jgi:hypothetical protein
MRRQLLQKKFLQQIPRRVAGNPNRRILKGLPRRILSRVASLFLRDLRGCSLRPLRSKAFSAP